MGRGGGLWSPRSSPQDWPLQHDGQGTQHPMKGKVSIGTGGTHRRGHAARQHGRGGHAAEENPRKNTRETGGRVSQQHGGGQGGERKREGQRPEGAGGARRMAAVTVSGAQEEGLRREGSRDPQAGMHDHS